MQHGKRLCISCEEEKWGDFWTFMAGFGLSELTTEQSGNKYLSGWK